MLSLDEIVAPARRGGQPVTSPRIAEPQHLDSETDDDVTAIDAALHELAALDARQAQIVEMRYFGGLTIEETAQAAGDLGRHREARVDARARLAAARAVAQGE